NKKIVSEYIENIEIILLQDLNEYIVEMIYNLENNAKLSFTIQVDVNMTDQNLNLKSIASVIVNSIEESDVIVKLKHEILHKRLIDNSTPMENKQEIKENIHLDPNFYKTDNDHVNSAYLLLKSDQTAGCELCYELMTSQITAIGFITSLYSKIQPMSKIHCDATYKTAKRRFKLHGLICSFKDAVYPLAYLILDTNKVSDSESQEKR
ncbi:2429_t:CDS:2, partial [Racocetra fulgida]